MRYLLRTFSGVMVTALVACSDTTDPISMNLADQLWSIRIEPKVITMSTVAPYDTITLRTIAINGLGDTITEGLKVEYSPVSDTSMRISADGVLKVRMPTGAQGTRIVTRVKYKNVTRTDTALVVVTTNAVPPYPLDTIILDAIDGFTGEPTQAILSINTSSLSGTVYIVSRVLSNGMPVASVPLSYVSSDESILLVDLWTGRPTPKMAGRARILASTTWYGKPYRTALDVYVVGPMSGEFHIQERIPRGSDTAVFVVTPGSIEVEPGAVVSWVNGSSRPVEIVFDDPASARELTGPGAQLTEFLCLITGLMCHVGKTSGNFLLPPMDPNNPNDDSVMDMRAFPDPGTYHFQVVPGGKGTIIVKSFLATH
jgi:plastocyanin